VNLKTSESLLPCHCPGRPNDGRIEKAVRVAEGDQALREKLEAQRQWDNQIMEVIRSIEPPGDLRARLNSHRGPVKAPPIRSHLLNPAILAVILGLLVLAGLLVKTELERRENFPGRGQVARMLDVTRNMSGVELEPVDGEAWQLGDWFYMKGFEGYALPAETAKLPALGSRVFRQDGEPVAQVALGEHDLIVLVFRPTSFGVQLPESDDWRFMDHEGWSAAIRRQGSTCTVITHRGKRAELKEIIASLKQ
jgi:hypothetical protein